MGTVDPTGPSTTKGFRIGGWSTGAGWGIGIGVAWATAAEPPPGTETADMTTAVLFPAKVRDGDLAVFREGIGRDPGL